MRVNPSDYAVLNHFRAVITEMFGERLERVVLFGSRAGGDARADSDYDVAVFLHDMPNRFVEMDRLADLSTDILDGTGDFIHAMPSRADYYNDPDMPLMHEIRTPVKPPASAFLGKAQELLDQERCCVIQSYVPFLDARTTSR